MIIAFALIPVLTAVISWLVLRTAFWLVTHPVKPVKLGAFLLQSIIYKKESALKAELVKTIKSEMIVVEELSGKLASSTNIDKLKPELNDHIDVFLKVRLKEAMPMIGMLIGDRTIGQLKALFMEELETLFPSVMKTYMSHIKDDLDLDALITDKVQAFPIQKLATIIEKQLADEVRKACLLAALAGFMLGLIQMIIVFLLVP